MFLVINITVSYKSAPVGLSMLFVAGIKGSMVKLLLWVITHRVVKTFWRVAVKLHAFLNSKLGKR